MELTKSTSSAVSSHSNGKGREKYEETTANRTPSRDYHHPLQPRIYPSYIAPSVAVTDPAYGYLPPPPAPSQAFPSPYPVPPYSMYPNYFYNQMNPMVFFILDSLFSSYSDCYASTGRIPLPCTTLTPQFLLPVSITLAVIESLPTRWQSINLWRSLQWYNLPNFPLLRGVDCIP